MRDDREVTVIETESSGLKWFLIGAALGASFGILFAPQAGDRTRRDLMRRGRQLRDKAGETINDLGQEIQERGRNIKRTVREFADEVLSEAEDGVRQVERTADSARDEMERRLADARARARAGVEGLVDDEDDAE